MSDARIEVITFDLWDTLLVDDSDEEKRAQLGLEPKNATRRTLLWQALQRCLDSDGQGGGGVSREQVDTAYDTADAAFNRVWHDLHVTWSVAERLQVVLAGLGWTLEKKELDELVQRTESMEAEVSPQIVADAAAVLAQLQADYRLAVISDTVFSPGWALRRILRKYELLRYFDCFCFSDEIGVSKPHPRLFEQVAAQCKTDVTRICHVGDREHNDVQGAHRVGARAVLFVGVKDRRGDEETAAEAVCRRLTELPELLAEMGVAGGDGCY